MESGIYIIKNRSNNKVYVGSSVSLPKRRSAHLSKLKTMNNLPKSMKEDVVLLGKSVFEFIVIEYCEEVNLLEREDFWMDVFSSLDENWGYNTNYALREGKSNVKVQAFKEDGSLYKEFNSPALAGAFLGGSKAVEEIRCRCNNKTRSRGKGRKINNTRFYKGYYWKYSNDKSDINTAIWEHKDRVSPAIYQYDLEGNLLAEYSSIHALGESISENGIRRILKGGHWNGSIWTKSKSMVLNYLKEYKENIEPYLCNNIPYTYNIYSEGNLIYSGLKSKIDIKGININSLVHKFKENKGCKEVAYKNYLVKRSR